MKKIIIFSITIVFIFLTNNNCVQKHTDSKQSASEFVESFYRINKLSSESLTLDEVNLRKNWFTNELNQLFENALKSEKEFMKKNPTDKPSFGDGIPIKPLEVGCLQVQEDGNEITSDGKILVKVEFFYKDNCSGDLIDIYKVELIKNENNWLINDCVYSKDNKLTDLLKTEY